MQSGPVSRAVWDIGKLLTTTGTRDRPARWMYQAAPSAGSNPLGRLGRRLFLWIGLLILGRSRGGFTTKLHLAVEQGSRTSC